MRLWHAHLDLLVIARPDNFMNAFSERSIDVRLLKVTFAGTMESLQKRTLDF